MLPSRNPIVAASDPRPIARIRVDTGSTRWTNYIWINRIAIPLRHSSCRMRRVDELDAGP